MSTPLSPTDLDLLRAADTPTVCNVIELFNVQPRNRGYMDGRIRACFPQMKPMVGYAVTATFRSSSPPPKGMDVYSGVLRQVEAFKQTAMPPVIVFQDLDEPPAGATMGEVMCSVYKAFGSVGLITSGAARDLDQVEALGFPLFAAGVNPSHAWCHIIDVNVPVNVGGLTVRAGDLLHGDRNGVSAIPLDIAGPVARACKPFMATEEVLFEYLRKPNPSLDGYKEARAKGKTILAELVKKVEEKKI